MIQLSENDFVRFLEATRAVNSTLSLQELLQTVMRLASEVVHAEASSLLLLDPATGELYFDMALGEKGGALERIRLKKGEGIAGWVSEHAQAAMVNDVAADPRWTKKADHASKFETKSILAVPMVARDKKVGVLEAINRADGAPFSERDLQMFEFFAAQVAVAIENARLFESVRQEEEKISAMLNQMTEGIMLVDTDGLVTVANPAAERFIGKDIRGRAIGEVELTFECRPPVLSLLAGAKTFQSIEWSRRSAPPLILSGSITPISGRRSTGGYLIVIADVTEERREAQLKRNFLSLVSHKLRTPLVAIRGFSPMLLEKPEELNAFQKTAIEAIDRNSLLLAGLVEKITMFTALESEHLELTPTSQAAGALLDAALSEMAAQLLRSQTAVTRDPSLETLPPVVVDKIWMREVFRNLIENAVKFCGSGVPRLTVRGQSLGTEIEIRFEDTGPGIPPEEQQKIFQKFYQVESSFTGQIQGMGLGLALVKRVVESHGGSAGVDSTLGRGSSFWIRLPTKQS